MKNPHLVREIKGPIEFAEAFSVSRETIERLKIYETLLQHWQKTINLVAPGTLGQVWHRHFADSAQIIPLAPPDAKTWIDLGSGAGFPGLVVAILLAADAKAVGRRITLIESDSRKAAFLREVARQVAVPVDILPLRIEAAATHVKLRGADVISARGLAPLTRLLGLALPFTNPTTLGLFLKGKVAQEELQAAETEWNFASRLVSSVTDCDARIIEVRDLAPKLKV